MDDPRIVIELADDIARELAREGKHDNDGLLNICAAFGGGMRLSRLSALLSHPDCAQVVATRLVDGDLRAEAQFEETLRMETASEEGNSPVPTLLGLFVLRLPGFDEEKTRGLLKSLRELMKPDPVTKQPPELDTAYYDEDVAMADVTEGGRGRFADQPYLTESGINLPVMREDAVAWAQYDGCGVQFIQIDGGWNVNHTAFNEEVRAMSPGTAFTALEIDHGNKALGIVLANGAESRIRGIAQNCKLKGLYALKHEASQPRQQLETGIRLATTQLGRGDVILLALQGRDTFLPVEVKTAVFKAIRAATSKGIIVIEAAGNQGTPLEDELEIPGRTPAWTDQRNVPRFRDLPDSGAIIVGGCTVTENGGQYDPPVQSKDARLGKRVDCCAWSEGVYTSAGELSDYGIFNGTSAAAPAIAGLALIIQQFAKERLGKALTPVKMRELFRDPDFGTPVQPCNPEMPISMPDAMKLFRHLEEFSS